MSESVVVIKLNPKRLEVWRYPGKVLWRRQGVVLVEAHFNRDDMDFHGILFERGDRFLELYYTDCWYNINELHDRGDDRLKGWYCNVCFPAEISDGRVAYVDLALDLLVFPDGSQIVLDEDEFEELDIDDSTRCRAWAALAELKQVFQPPVTMRLADLSAWR